MTHMSDAERHLAREFRLHPQEARVLDILREAVGYCPDEMIPVLSTSGDNYRQNLISRVRKKMRRHGVAIVRVPGGYRLEAA